PPEPPAAEAAPSEESAPVPEPAEEPAAEQAAEEQAAEEGPAAEGAFDKAPPKGLLIGVAAGVVAVLLALGGLFAYRKLAKHPPPPAAIESMTAAQADADKDTLASIAAAEGKAKEALDVAGPKSSFPEGIATLARIEVQWADAFNDQAALITARGGADAETKAGDLQSQAKVKLKAAAELLSPAMKSEDNRKSADIQLAQADYFRAQRSNTNMNKALKQAQALK